MTNAAKNKTALYLAVSDTPHCGKTAGSK